MKTNKNLSQSIILEKLLNKTFGKDNVKVIKWKWTEEQLQQLEEEKKIESKKAKKIRNRS